jgi:hypothetical protein
MSTSKIITRAIRKNDPELIIKFFESIENCSNFGLSGSVVLKSKILREIDSPWKISN